MRPIPDEIEALFNRYPALTGFSIRAAKDIPDNCPRSGEEGELFVTDIGIIPLQSSEQYGELFEELTATLADLLAEPGGEEELRGRTFARTIH